MIFYGPPGTGKTTLAQLLATETQSAFRQLNAVTSGVKELREVLRRGPRPPRRRRRRGRCCSSTRSTASTRPSRTCCLPDVEEGIVMLVGATTQNPFFAVNCALVSRSRVFQFQAAVASTTSRRSCAARWPTRSAGWATI